MGLRNAFLGFGVGDLWVGLSGLMLEFGVIVVAVVDVDEGSRIGFGASFIEARRFDRW